MLRIAGTVFLVDLMVALLALSVYKVWIYPEHRPLFLILVNANMMLCAVAAVASALVSMRLRRGGTFGWLLVVTLICLVLAELGAFILELRSVEALDSGLIVLGIGIRLGVAALAGWAAARPLPGEANHSAWTTPCALAVVVAAVWGLTLVAYPLWLDGHGADALVAACAVLALAMVAVALWRGGAGHPLQAPFRFFALAGLCLYLITDLSYMRHMALGDQAFVVAEMGFYGGYLLVAWGALKDSGG